MLTACSPFNACSLYHKAPIDINCVIYCEDRVMVTISIICNSQLAGSSLRRQPSTGQLIYEEPSTGHNTQGHNAQPIHEEPSSTTPVSSFSTVGYNCEQ